MLRNLTIGYLHIAKLTIFNVTFSAVELKVGHELNILKIYKTGKEIYCPKKSKTGVRKHKNKPFSQPP